MNAQQLLETALSAHRHGDLEQADRLYRELLSQAPRHLAALHMLGVVCAQRGRNGEATDLLARVVEQTPHDALALSNFGNALWQSGQFQKALEVLNRSIGLVPGNPDAFNNRGNVLAALGRYAEALDSFDRAIALRPDFALAYSNKADVLRDLGRHVDALACYDRAIDIDPGSSDAFFGKGAVLRSQARYGQALSCYEKSLELRPGRPDALNNRAVCQQNLGQISEAMDVFRQLGSAFPEMIEARLNLATALLLQERFDEGFRLFELRKQARVPVENRRYAQPLWTGVEDISDKTLFLYIELGLGDAIMFYRFALALRDKCRHLILAVHPCLLRLFASNSTGISLIGLDDAPGDFDYHIPLASMPLALGLRFDTIPCKDAYLHAEPERVREWAARLGSDGFRIGIAWEGNTSIPGAEGKSFRLDHLNAISQIEGVRLINLQKYGGSEQLASAPPKMTVESFAFDEGADAFLDTAAIMQNCHLVISADTAPAHLAGALGIPCWVALKFVPEWRWFLARSDSPWYARTRLFRQDAPGEWGSVFAAMASELRSARL
jgi:tetratricopeptide (TPR) repeat protein